MSEIVISVVITTYNRKYEVARAIKSVLNQTRKPDEIIIVDDHSNDGTQEYIKNICGDKIIYIYNENTVGVEKSRNIGIKNSKGNYIAILDSDNVWRQDKLKIIEGQLEEKFVDIICSRYNQHVGFEKIVKYNLYDKINEGLLEQVFLFNIVDASSTVYSAQFLQLVDGFSEEYNVNGDWELIIKGNQKKHLCINYVDDVLSENWELDFSLAKKNNIKAIEINKTILKYLDKLLENYSVTEVINKYYNFIENSSEDKIWILNQIEIFINRIGCFLLKKNNELQNKLNFLEDENNSLRIQCSTINGENAMLQQKLNVKWKQYDMMRGWMEIYNDNLNIDNYFIENRYHKIAIYGCGRHGKMICDYFMKNNMKTKIVAFIDINAMSIESYKNIPVFGINEGLKQDFDILVISIIGNGETIKDELLTKTDKKMVYFDELIYKTIREDKKNNFERV